MDSKLIEHFAAFGKLSDEEIAAIDNTMSVEHYKKGTVLLRSGQFSNDAFFVLEGIVRKYYLADGEEKTSDFFTDGNWVVSVINISQDAQSNYFLECAVDCTLIVGDSRKGEHLYKAFPNLGNISRKLMEHIFKTQQEKLEAYVHDSPEQRYTKLLQERPDLFQSVPQYHIACYVGVTPESLSRIRKRMSKRPDTK